MERKLPSEKFKDLKDSRLFCTPSVFEEVKKSYNSNLEASVSVAKFGKPQDSTGVFGEMSELARIAYKNSDGFSHFGYGGTSGANMAIFNLIGNMFTKYDSKPHVLAARNVHQSVVEGAMNSKVPVRYVDTNFDSSSGLFLPPTVDDVLKEMNSDTKVVLITRPNYEGGCFDLERLIKELKVRDNRSFVYVDEAWGAHLAFNPNLPTSAIELGADIATQSMHKQGGGINPSNITHFGKRMKDHRNEFYNSFNVTHTTSPSYPLLASMDVTRQVMQEHGKERIETLIEYASRFRQYLSSIDGVEVMTFEKYPSIVDSDLTKVNIDVRKTGMTGGEISNLLQERYKIIPEKDEIGSLTFIMNFALNPGDIEYTADKIRGIIQEGRRDDSASSSRKNYAPLPRRVERAYESFEVQTMKKEDTPFDIKSLVGKVSGENIKCYPPGIYVVQMGEVFDKITVEYLIEQRSRDGSLHMCDHNNKYVKTVDMKK